MPRTDVHAPTNFDPADYEYQTGWDNSPRPVPFTPGFTPVQSDFEFRMPGGAVVKERNTDIWMAQAIAFRRWLSGLSNPFFGNFSEKGTCDHCGTYIRYCCLYLHKPSGQYIVVGETCSGDRFGCDSRRTFEITKLRKRAANRAELERAFKAATEWLDENAPDMKDALLGGKYDATSDILANMGGKLRQYGNMSDKALNFARTLVEREVEKEGNGGKTDRELEREARDKAWDDKAIDAPAGREFVTGKVVGMKTYDGYDYNYTKMMVEENRFFKVWVTVPSAIAADVKRGDVVKFKATLKPWDDNANIASGSRPSNSEILEQAS